MPTRAHRLGLRCDACGDRDSDGRERRPRVEDPDSRRSYLR